MLGESLRADTPVAVATTIQRAAIVFAREEHEKSCRLFPLSTVLAEISYTVRGGRVLHDLLDVR